MRHVEVAETVPEQYPSERELSGRCRREVVEMPPCFQMRANPLVFYLGCQSCRLNLGGFLEELDYVLLLR